MSFHIISLRLILCWFIFSVFISIDLQFPDSLSSYFSQSVFLDEFNHKICVFSWIFKSFLFSSPKTDVDETAGVSIK